MKLLDVSSQNLGLIGLILLIVTIFSIIVLNYLLKKQHNSIQNKIELLLSSYGKIEQKNSKIIFTINSNEFEIIFFPQFSKELIMNSFTIWEIRNKGTVKQFDMSKKLNSDNKKIVIVINTESSIKRYINENEMVFIDYKNPINSTYIVKLNELEDCLKLL